MSEFSDALQAVQGKISELQDEHKAQQAAEELPEVWYLNADKTTGWHFGAGLHACMFWTESNSALVSSAQPRGFSLHVTCTKAEYDNAYALHHGADFTGKLHEIDRPVCELNQATRDEMETHKWNEVETNMMGRWALDSSGTQFSVEKLIASPFIFRLRKPQTRPWTQDECIGWAYNEGATGWQVLCDGDAYNPTLCDFEDVCGQSRRTIAPDGTTGEPMPFEVPA